MKKLTLLLMLALILPTVQAAITFTITPATQTVQPGQTFNVNLNVNNDQAFWGFSLKIDENPTGPIAYTTSTTSTRLTGSFNGITINNPNRITPYALFAGNTPGITTGTGALFTMTYTVPSDTPPGQYTLIPSQLTISDQNGNPITGATITGATITVNEILTPFVGYKLPELIGNVEETIEVPICLSNTEANAVTGADITITHNGELAKVTKVDILRGTGSSQITEGSTHITITGLNILNANCNAQTGVNVAKIHYYLRALGTTPLTVQSATATPYSPQQFANNNGQIQVTATDVRKTCEPNMGIITAGSPVTITYRVHNPFTTVNVGGVDETDTYNAFFTPTLPPTNLRAGSSLTYNTPAANTIRTVHTSLTQPFLNGPGTFNLYSVIFTSAGLTPPGVYNFDVLGPTPPTLEISDPFHQEITQISNGLCSVTVITSCNNNSDCDDGNFCNGQETCDAQGVCHPGTPPNCDDGNPCTNDYCENNACHHDAIPGCTPPTSTGGGGGGHQQYFTGCGMCNTTGYTDWECCGMSIEQIRKFCERPETFLHYCEQKGVKKEMTAPQMPTPAVTPEEEQPVVYEDGSMLLPEEPEITETEFESGTGTTSINSDGLLGWIIGLIILLLVAGAFGAYTIIRHKTPQPMPPIPNYKPMEPVPQAPKPVLLPPIITKPEEEKVTPESILKTKKYDPYEAAIRRRLAKIMKTKKKR